MGGYGIMVVVVLVGREAVVEWTGRWEDGSDMGSASKTVAIEREPAS